MATTTKPATEELQDFLSMKTCPDCPDVKLRSTFADVSDTIGPLCLMKICDTCHSYWGILVPCEPASEFSHVVRT